MDAAPRPPGRSAAAVTWDEAHSSLVVFGGSGFNPGAGPGNSGIPLGDGWAWNGRKWSPIGGSGPPALALPSAMWDRGNQRVIVLLGLSCPNPSSAEWAWDGSAWTSVGPAGIPARWGAALAQDPEGHGLLFGGSDQKGC